MKAALAFIPTDTHDPEDSLAVQARLQAVTQICGARNAFAAVREDGELVVWGDSPGAAPLRLSGRLVSSDGAFCALGDQLVAWGDARYGGVAPSLSRLAVPLGSFRA